MNTSKIRRGILIIVYNQKEEFLLLKHKKNLLWGFISGGIEDNETDIVAALREANEESGINMDINNLIKTEEIIRFISSKGPGEQVVFLYKTDSKLISIDNREICEFGWFTKGKALSLLEQKPPLKKLLLDLFSN